MRAKRLLVSPEVFMRQCTVGRHSAYDIIEDPVPDDAKLVSTRWSEDHCAIEITVGHESFEDLPEGAEPPLLLPVARTVGNE